LARFLVGDLWCEWFLQGFHMPRKAFDVRLVLIPVLGLGLVGAFIYFAVNHDPAAIGLPHESQDVKEFKKQSAAFARVVTQMLDAFPDSPKEYLDLNDELHDITSRVPSTKTIPAFRPTDLLIFDITMELSPYYAFCKTFTKREREILSERSSFDKFKSEAAIRSRERMVSERADLMTDVSHTRKMIRKLSEQLSIEPPVSLTIPNKDIRAAGKKYRDEMSRVISNAKSLVAEIRQKNSPELCASAAERISSEWRNTQFPPYCFDSADTMSVYFKLIPSELELCARYRDLTAKDPSDLLSRVDRKLDDASTFLKDHYSPADLD
jgi:hypothetical protein